jgi:hypothetical protein
MDTVTVAGAAVTGARHRRIGRNGQDAVATWLGDGMAAVVVCDGCSAGASSEVGARLGAALWIAAVARRMRRGAASPAMWSAVRDEVVAKLASLVEAMTGDRALAIREHFLFTVVSAAVSRDGASVWALGDGAYSMTPGDTRVLGPFADNQPPYLAYDLLGCAQPPHVAEGEPGLVVVATDGALDLAIPLDGIVRDRLAHPDGLRRRLEVLARGGERIDWEARAVERTPALRQADGAIAAIDYGEAPHGRWRS